MKNWQSVYKSEMPYRAGIVKDLLEANMLKPVMVNKKDSSYQFGYYEIFVEPEFVLRAIKTITDEISFE